MKRSHLLNCSEKEKILTVNESVAVRIQAESLDRKLNGLMNAVRGQGRHGG